MKRLLVSGVLLTVALAASAGEAVRHGLYIEKWPNGKKKIACWYKKGVLSGSYKEYSENGKLIQECTYRDGLIEGVYREFFESGRPRLAAQYSAGKPNGRLMELDETGKVVRDQVFVNGLLKYPRSLAEISAGIKKIMAEVDPGGGGGYDEPPSHEGEIKPGKLSEGRLSEALAYLKCYRYLAGVPHEDIELNDRYNTESQHATVLLAIIGGLSHTPAKPAGVSDEFYKVAYAGTSHSNLSMGSGSLTKALDRWMNDSDPSNIDRIGHRRWCINPTMKQTGFGLYGKFAAIWALDRSRKPEPDFDYIPWPVQGFHPAEYFGKGWAWNVSLNPKKYKKPVKGKARGKIFELDDQFRDKGGPLELDYENVDCQGFGVPACIIFRPKTVSLTPGSKYRVEIEGVEDKKSGGPAKITYVVEFCRLPK